MSSSTTMPRKWLSNCLFDDPSLQVPSYVIIYSTNKSLSLLEAPNLKHTDIIIIRTVIFTSDKRYRDQMFWIKIIVYELISAISCRDGGVSCCQVRILDIIAAQRRFLCRRGRRDAVCKFIDVIMECDFGVSQSFIVPLSSVLYYLIFHVSYVSS
jgi:hypothetical protein